MNGETMALAGQSVVVIGGSAGMGFETARLASQQGADVIITAPNPDRQEIAGKELGASVASFDATDFGRLANFFAELPGPIDHPCPSGTSSAQGTLPPWPSTS
jgi:NAD(P)-dependent dehydrogenase (short-subunit alcohol dehydrogenase family)